MTLSIYLHTSGKPDFTFTGKVYDDWWDSVVRKGATTSLRPAHDFADEVERAWPQDRDAGILVRRLRLMEESHMVAVERS